MLIAETINCSALFIATINFINKKYCYGKIGPDVSRLTLILTIISSNKNGLMSPSQGFENWLFLPIFDFRSTNYMSFFIKEISNGRVFSQRIPYLNLNYSLVNQKLRNYFVSSPFQAFIFVSGFVCYEVFDHYTRMLCSYNHT